MPESARPSTRKQAWDPGPDVEAYICAVLAVIDALARPARPGGRVHSGTDQGEP
jgi:hypothetical protein